MFVELLETLRCPRPHEETQLVVTATRTESRHIVEGVLGCPVCASEFPISDGQVRFGDPLSSPALEPPSAEIAMRLAAFLELTDARGFALLCGRWGAQADQIQRLAVSPLVLVNPPVGFVGEVAGVIQTADVVPFAASSARAAALDTGMSDALVASVVRAVNVGGRMMGPTSLAVPSSVTELVRDDRDWVGEKTAPSATDQPPRLVSISRSSR